MTTIKTHFKRHGSANWLEILLTDEYYIECNKGKNYIVDAQRSINGHITERFNKEYETLDYQAIEKDLNTFLKGVKIELEHFIESYHIPQTGHDTDRDFINNIDVTGMTTAEVFKATGITLTDYFKSWRVAERHETIKQRFETPTQKMLDMKFKELYALIHWNCHKKGFEETFIQATA